MSVNQYGKDYGATANPVSSDGVDVTIAKGLSIRMRAVASLLESFVYQANTSQIYTALSRRLRDARPEFKSDAEALIPVMALLGAQLLSVATWNITYSDGAQVTSSPISWHTYGSGPRLRWEWAASAIVGVLLLSMLMSFLLSCIYRIQPGRWLKLGGMLVAANRSPPIPKLIDHPGDVEHLEGVRLFVVKSAQSNAAIISDDNVENLRLDGHKTYTWWK